MMPVYMDQSQPCQMRPQGYYYQGGFGNNSQHMTMDAPPPCHGSSCVHGNFPAYNAYWPPCYPPQVPYHPYCMNHSVFYPPHASYAPPCFVHPPIPVGYQQAWCDSDKDVPGKHQCGKCSPQICNLKKDRGVVIEEHEPEIEKGNQGEALYPVRSTNCPYPIIWVPHENARNQKHGSSLSSGDHNQPPSEVKPAENTMTVQKSFPKSWNGYFPFDENTIKSMVQNQDRQKVQNGKTFELPFDISKLKSLLQGQDMKEAQIHKSKEEPGQIPYPTSWIPSRGKRDDVEASESSNENMKKMHKEKNLQYPFDISKLKSLLQSQDVKEAQNQKNKEEPGQLPYPIFWIPSCGKREDVEASESKESSNEGRNLESCPSDLHGNEGQKTQREGKEGNFEHNVFSDAEEKSSVRNIPVENHLKKPRNIPVKLSENHLPKPTEPTNRVVEENEPVKNTKKEQSSSSSKASKLPPVCLRVDPLPKKRNGGSKSPSPPKRKEESIMSEKTKVASPLCSKTAESRTVPEACNVTCQEKNKEMKMSEGNLNATGTEKETVESNSNLQEVSKCEIVKPSETNEYIEQPAKKTFTEEEAARIIQSRYRGYDVRRWEPVKKLKEIATVREQMGDVKKRIQALEVSTDHHIEEKEIVVIGEMVMNLLLKLDAVQGLHPSMKDYRKSLARELSGIQEKLDSLKNSNANAEIDAVKEQVEINSQAGDSPVNLEHSQLAEENKMVSDSNQEKLLRLTPEEHPMSVLNRTDEQPASEAEEKSGLFETLAMDPEQPTENEPAASLTTIPEKIGEVETVVPINPLSADGNRLTVTNAEENKVMVELEEPVNELPQVVKETHGTSSTPDLENSSEISEAESKASENEDKKGDDDTILPSEKDVELSELPVGVIDDETQLLSQDSSSCTPEAKITAMDPETASQEETDVDHSLDNLGGIAQETCEPQDEEEESPETEEVIVKEQSPEKEVNEHEISEETKKLMEENQRFKETVETLVKAGREQLQVISKLSSRVKSLEKKLSHKKRAQIRRRATKPVSASSTDAVL